MKRSRKSAVISGGFPPADFVLFVDRRTSPCKVSVLKLHSLNLSFARASERKSRFGFLPLDSTTGDAQVVLRKISASPEVIGFCRKFLPLGFLTSLILAGMTHSGA